ncbi:MAG: AMP-dependent synthetase/ligase [Spirochaetaceae bacterium]
MENATVLSMLQHAAETFTDVPYVWNKTDAGWQPLTFAEVQEAARSVAAALLNRGFAPDSKMVILSEGRQEWVVSEFAALYAGGISVPLSIKLLPEEIPYRVNHSEAEIIVASRNTLPKLLEVWQKLESNPTVLFLDRIEALPEGAATLKEQGRIIDYPGLLKEGRDRPPETTERLKQIEESIDQDDVVTISYTSGTTGNPKGIMLTHRNYFANCRDSVEIFRVPLGYKTLLILPCDHSFAHTVGLYAALLRGISIYFVDARGGSMATLRNIPVNLKEANPVFLLTVPALTGNFMKKIRSAIEEKGGFVERLFNKGVEAGIAYHGDGYHKPPFGVRLRSWLPYKLADAVVFRKVRETFGKDIEFCVGGGALLDIRQQEFFKAIGVPIYQGYGLTEAAPVISSNTGFAHKMGSSGKILATVHCRIVREDGTEAEVGETGQIVIQGDNVMKGYFKNPEATAETIKDGWLYTGDRGYMDEDGFLNVVGREKALLISPDGEKYSPEEIEEAIVNASPLIEQALVYNDHNRFTGALITLDREAVQQAIDTKKLSTAEEVLDELRNSLYAFKNEDAYRKRFPEQWIPATFQVVEEPFTEENKLINSSMKVVRFRVVERYQDLLDRMFAEDGPDYRNDKNREAVRNLFRL